MTRRLLALFFVAILLCLSCVRTRTVLDQGGYRHLADAVVIVFSPPTGLCAGFYIEQNRILTNAHCLRTSGLQVYEVASYHQYLNDENGSLYFLRHVDSVRDLAVMEELFTDPENISNVPRIYEGDYPRPGSDTIVIGHPAGQLFNMTVGVVSRIGRRDMDTGVDYLFSTAPVWRGNSGGPIFNQYGEVIGITRGIRQDQSFLGQFIAYTEIREFLEEVEEIENEEENSQERW